jgi:hypothetical protein
MRWMQVLQHRMIHLAQVWFLFLSSLITVVGLTCNTRAVSRIPLAFMAISTICSLIYWDWRSLAMSHNIGPLAGGTV